MRSGGAIPPPHKRGISAILARCSLKTSKTRAIPPSAILSRKGIARYGGVSRTGPLRSLPLFVYPLFRPARERKRETEYRKCQQEEIKTEDVIKLLLMTSFLVWLNVGHMGLSNDLSGAGGKLEARLSATCRKILVVELPLIIKHRLLQDSKNRPKIKFLGIMLLGHQGPKRRDIPDPGPGMSWTTTLCRAPFSIISDGVSRDLGAHLGRSENSLRKKTLGDDFSSPISLVRNRRGSHSRKACFCLLNVFSKVPS